MADVYRARLVGSAGFAKSVVVKRLKQRYRDIPEVVRMFVAEARLSAEVQHRNIVQVFEFLEHEGELLIVMEYISGSDLRRALKRAARGGLRVPPWLSLHIVCEVLEGLVYTHDLCDEAGRPRNIIHRDVAPDNIFLSRQGDVKLGDFGIAQQGTTTTPELDDHIKGKLPYMAPELFEGRGFDHRIDVFAASVVLWECLTQRRLFKRKTNVEMIRSVCLDPRVPPSMYAHDIPRELDRIVVSGLDVDPRRRLSSAQEMQAMLLDLLRRVKPQLSAGEVKRAIRALLDDPAEEADDLIIDVEEVREEPILELSPWDVISDSGVWATPTPDVVAVPVPEDDRTPPPMLLDTWDSGNYSIVRGKPVAPAPKAPIRARPGNNDTSDFIKTTETRIPIPGGPGNVETGDILRNYVTEPFSGQPGPAYYLKTSTGELGPLYLTEVMEKVRSHLEFSGSSVSIGSDGIHWISVPQFLELSGQEIGTPDTFMPRGAVSGSLSGRSIISLLGEMARQRVTGRLVVAKASLPPAARREVHFFHGQPTYVGASDPELQPQTLLVQHGLVRPNQLDDCLRVMIAEQRPLEYVLSRRANVDVDRCRAFVMTLRLETIFAWSSGHFAFDASTPPNSTRPFATSIYGLLPLIVDRTRSNRDLERAIAPYLDCAYSRSSDFDSVTAYLNLSPSEISWLKVLPQYDTIGEWLLSAPLEERAALILVHLLVELGLLRQAKAKTSSSPDFHRGPSK